MILSLASTVVANPQTVASFECCFSVVEPSKSVGLLQHVIPKRMMQFLRPIVSNYIHFGISG